MTEIETRVSLVEQNYEHLERRMEKVEHKLDEVSNDLKSGQQALIKVIIGTTGTIMVGLISTIGVIIVSL